MKIEVNSLKPQASVDAINKIIDGKVSGYDINQARTTKSMYLTFDVPQLDKNFEIRISDHSKIDEIDDDEIKDNDDTISINIFSKENKEKAIKYLKSFFAKIDKLPASKDVFKNVVSKRILKSKYPEIVETYLKKIKVDTSKTTKQVREQVLEKLIKMKPKATLTKKEYEKSRGLFRYVGEKQYTGIATGIASTGGQATVNGETGKEFFLHNELHKTLLSFIKGSDTSLEFYLKNKK